MVGIINKKKIDGSHKNKMDIAGKAGLTTALKYTEGKELVELSPWSLIPDPNNPRPGEIIDDAWLLRVLRLNTKGCLCVAEGRNLICPDFEKLSGDLGGVKEEDYESLIMLAKSIRSEGIIQPIEVFLADKKYEPEYFIDREEDHGYVVLEGHQRRLAAMIAGVQTVTCIQISDEAFIKQLQVKHRKLKRQLSENNIRKSLTSAQHYHIFQELLGDDASDEITAVDLSNISGLGVKACEALKKLIKAEEGRYPSILYNKISEGNISLSVLKEIIYMSFNEIVSYFEPIKKSKAKNKEVKPRGVKGGRTKKSATFQIKSESDSLILGNYIQRHIPGLEKVEDHSSPYKTLEILLQKLLEKAKEDA